MKKVISIILVATVILSVLIFPASASTNTGMDIYRANGSDEYLYFDRAAEYHNNRYGEGELFYIEYCHFTDENSEVPDWVLMECQIDAPPWLYRTGAVVGNRVLYVTGGPGDAKTPTGFWVYIPKTDTFIVLANQDLDQIVELCPDFIEVIEEKEIGQLLGDVNEDNAVNILDVTFIQLGLTGDGRYYLWTDMSQMDILIGDYDRDCEVTILDATAIQKMLAGLE